jgi:hypothetical protein
VDQLVKKFYGNFTDTKGSIQCSQGSSPGPQLEPTDRSSLYSRILLFCNLCFNTPILRLGFTNSLSPPGILHQKFCLHFSYSVNFTCGAHFFSRHKNFKPLAKGKAASCVGLNVRACLRPHTYNVQSNQVILISRQSQYCSRLTKIS